MKTSRVSFWCKLDKVKSVDCPGGGGRTSISAWSETCLPLGSPFSAKSKEQGLKFP